MVDVDLGLAVLSFLLVINLADLSIRDRVLLQIVAEVNVRDNLLSRILNRGGNSRTLFYASLLRFLQHDGTGDQIVADCLFELRRTLLTVGRSGSQDLLLFSRGNLRAVNGHVLECRIGSKRDRDRAGKYECLLELHLMFSLFESEKLTLRQHGR